jgi:hypothetical protein
MLKLQPTIIGQQEPLEYLKYRRAVVDAVNKIKQDVVTSIDGVSIDIDLLFNAYTEEKFGQHIRDNESFGFSKLYADSGGLQIVTQGKQVSDQLKKKIYATQSVADFAMCFDEIPTRSIKISNGNGGGSRSQVSDKMYFPNQAKECAIKTAQNINEQCRVISNITDKSKVLYIIQGNTDQDMVDWFSHGIKELDNFDTIGGLALADTCIGNGVLESVDMFIGYKRIYDEYGDSVAKRHIHLLGVGSVNRLMPTLWVKDSMLPEDITVSFDSTSASMTYMMGKFVWKNGKGCKKQHWGSYMTEVLEYFWPILSKQFPDANKDKFHAHIMKSIMSTADTANNCEYGIHLGQAHITLTILYQIFGFLAQLKQAIEEMKQSNSPLSHLQHIKTYDDILHWKRQFSRYVSTARIQREPGVTLEFA